MSFANWVNDRRWAANMRRARAFRRGLLFSDRRLFDDILRPRVNVTDCIGYPDAFYHVRIEDLLRAVQAIYDRQNKASS